MFIRSLVQRILITFFLCLFLSACSFLEWLWLMPWAKDSLKTHPNTETEQVFACSESTLSQFHNDWDAWRIDHIKKDIENRVFESGSFHEPNQVDFRIHLFHVPEDSIIELELKGSWAYYGDLGVDEGIFRFKEALKNCLEHSDKHISGNFIKSKK
jgi:hypothetical protein